MTALVTGASGFIGRRLCEALRGDRLPFRGLQKNVTGNASYFVGNLCDPGSLAQACTGINTVFHCAGHAHAFSSLNKDDAALHWQINFEGTKNLLRACADVGVARFIFLSSVKAMAEPGDLCVDETFAGEPSAAYGQSKLAAEKAVLETGLRYGMHVVNLRLSMVYGSGGRGNLERMGRLVKLGLFPPLPETGNHRSLVHVADVVSAMRFVADDDRANGRAYIVACQHAPSGRGLFDALRQAQGLPACRWSVPASLLRGGGNVGDWLERFSGRRLPLDSEVVDRLLNSAWYSPARIERELGWRAQVSLVDGLSEMLNS